MRFAYATAMVAGLLAASLPADASRLHDDLVPGVDEWELTFTAPTEEPITSEEAAFIDQVVVDAFNEVFDPSERHAEEAEIEESSVQHDAMVASSGPLKSRFGYDLTLTLRRGICRICNPDPDFLGGKETVQNAQWASKICEKFNAGPFEALQGTSDCATTYIGPVANDVVPFDGEVSVEFTSDSAKLLNEEEQVLLDVAFVDAFNAVHNARQFSIGEAHVAKADVVRMNGLRGGKFGFKYTFRVEDARIHGQRESPMVVMSAKRRSTWELAMCNNLSKLSFEGFSGVRGCKIVIERDQHTAVTAK